MSNIIIYCNGLFDQDDSHLPDLMNSGVNTIILWSLHVWATGDLYYNNTLIVDKNGNINSGKNIGQVNPNMPADLKKLRTGGVSNVLFSIGAGGPPTPQDFHNIQTLLSTPQGTATLTRNFTALAKWLGLDGFDYDDEEDGIQVNTITKLTGILTPLGAKNLITFCPYGDPPESFWLDCMASIYQSMKKQPVAWWNLQNYGGGDPSSWISAMATYIKSKNIGVTNPNSFIFPGIEPYGGPTQIEQTFAAWQQEGLALQGGFIWNLSEIYNQGLTPKQCATAILAGLNTQMKQRKAV